MSPRRTWCFSALSDPFDWGFLTAKSGGDSGPESDRGRDPMFHSGFQSALPSPQFQRDAPTELLGILMLMTRTVCLSGQHVTQKGSALSRVTPFSESG